MRLSRMFPYTDSIHFVRLISARRIWRLDGVMKFEARNLNNHTPPRLPWSQRFSRSARKSGGLLDPRRRHIWSKIELFDELDSSKIALNSSTSFALFAILRKRTHHASGVLNWKMRMLRCSNVARRWSNECNTKQHVEMLRDVARKFDENQTRLTGA